MRSPQEFTAKSPIVLFFKIGGFQSFIFLTWIGLFGFLGAANFATAQLFAQDGQLATAEVTGKSSERVRHKQNRSRVVYFLELRFQTEHGNIVQLNRRVGGAEYDQAEVGSEIEIAYLSSDVERVETSPGSNRKRAFLYATLAGISCIFLLASLTHYVRRVQDAVFARRFGRREQVQLVKVKRNGWWKFGKSYSLVWQDSESAEGKSIAGKADRFLGWRAGDTLTIYHGRNTSWWAGDIGDSTFPPK